MAVEKTKHGTWRARWRDDHGTQKAKTFRRKIDADRFLAQTLTDLHRGTYIDPRSGTTTIRAYADTWLTGAMNLGAGGRDTYRRDLDRYILPKLGDLPLRRATKPAIDEFLADELARGLAPSTVHRHYRTLRRMLQVAVDAGHLARNPCDHVTPPRLEQTEMRFLTPGQAQALTAAIGERWAAWTVVATYGGLRWSETVGLRRRSVDGPRVTVTEQLIRRTDGQWHREPPKTRAGRRTVTLPAFATEVLDHHLDTWAQDGPDGLVFPNRAGNPMIGSSFTQSVFKPAVVRAGLDSRLRIHDLRHTAVALAIAAGAHPKAIQARMGHASISVTMDRYGHLFPEMDSGIADGLQALHAASVAPRLRAV